MMTGDGVSRAIQTVGFAKGFDLFSEEDLSRVEPILDNMTLHSTFHKWLRHEMSDNPGERPSLQIELSRPSIFSRALRKSRVFEKCHEIASAVLGCRTYYLYDHAIYKMPKTDAVTPWHQDQAYLGETVDINSLHFWIPFQQCNEKNGSMRFVAGSHRELLIHHRPFKNNQNLLEVCSRPEAGIYNMLLDRGDVSIHTHLTLHGAGANQSDHIRKAWIIHFGDRSSLSKRWMQVRAELASFLPI